jgi:hypothetical protein
MSPSDVSTADILSQRLLGEDGLPVKDVFDDSSLLHVPGRSGLSGEYQGGDAILGLLRRMSDLTNGTWGFSRSSLLTADDRLIVLRCISTARRHAKTLDADVATVVQLRCGKVREMWIVSQDQAQFDDFWS